MSAAMLVVSTKKTLAAWPRELHAVSMQELLVVATEKDLRLSGASGSQYSVPQVSAKDRQQEQSVPIRPAETLQRGQSCTALFRQRGCSSMHGTVSWRSPQALQKTEGFRFGQGL